MFVLLPLSSLVLLSMLYVVDVGGAVAACVVVVVVACVVVVLWLKPSLLPFMLWMWPV